MRNRRAVIWTIRITFWWKKRVLAAASEVFINWLTDVTSQIPAYVGSHIAWEVSALDVPFGHDLLKDTSLLITLFPKLFEAYQKHT
ncbi:hypothetical protein MMC16_002138 [Acarospora aff. strigata]|nr:hypothetical protein [Acarospora aff. strigata]